MIESIYGGEGPEPRWTAAVEEPAADEPVPPNCLADRSAQKKKKEKAATFHRHRPVFFQCSLRLRPPLVFRSETICLCRVSALFPLRLFLFVLPTSGHRRSNVGCRTSFRRHRDRGRVVLFFFFSFRSIAARWWTALVSARDGRCGISSVFERRGDGFFFFFCFRLLDRRCEWRGPLQMNFRIGASVLKDARVTIATKRGPPLHCRPRKMAGSSSIFFIDSRRWGAYFFSEKKLFSTLDVRLNSLH